MADHYIRAGATGGATGADWTNAWTTLPSPLTRGDTYYIADGTYADYDFDDAVSGATYIYIKKATAAAHGTETGWDSSYGDGQAIFSAAGNPVAFETDYWDFDGVVGSGTSGHGFAVQVTGSAANIRGILFSGAGHLNISHVEVTSTQPENVADGDKQDGIYSTSGSGYVTISYCYIHNWKRCGVIFSSLSNCIVDHCYFYHTYSTSGAHGQAIQLGPGACSDITVRYSIFKDCHGTGIIVALDNTFSDLFTYGNIFWEDEESAAIGIYSTSQAIGTTAGDTVSNWKIYNNTFIGMDGRSPQPSGGIDMNGTSEGNEAYNNLWIDCVLTFDACAHDYNWIRNCGVQSEDHIQNGSGDPFVDAATGNFHLSAATDAGTTVVGYATDPDGNTRGADGVWDRGAYEYAGASGFHGNRMRIF